MHILHIDLGREMRGGQHQVIMLMRGLREAGHSSELLTLRDSPLNEAAAADNFRVTASGWRALRTRAADADVVHAHDARAHTLAALGSKCPFVVSRRVAFAVRRGWLSRWKYRQPWRFLAVSKFVASRLRVAGVASEKIDIVYDGAAEWSGRAAETIGKRVVAPASRDPEKGRDLAEAAAKLTSRPILFSDNLARDLPGAAVFLYLTRSEGLGSAVLAAMNLGVPVIASRVDGLPEAVADGETGLLVANEPAAIAAALLTLGNDAKLAHRLGTNGRRRVTENFTVDHMVTSTLAAYGRALATVR